VLITELTMSLGLVSVQGGIHVQLKRFSESIRYGFVFVKAISSELPLLMYPGTQRADPSLKDLTKHELS